MEIVSLHIRIAQLQDSRPVYELRTSPKIRENSLDSTSFSFESHDEWFRKTLDSQSRLLFVVESDQEMVAVVRYDLDDSEQEAIVSIYVSEQYFGRGIGKWSLNSSEILLKKQFPGLSKIKAQVLVDNESSISLFTKCGFKQTLVEFHKEVL